MKTNLFLNRSFLLSDSLPDLQKFVLALWNIYIYISKIDRYNGFHCLLSITQNQVWTELSSSNWLLGMKWNILSDIHEEIQPERTALMFLIVVLTDDIMSLTSPFGCSVPCCILLWHHLLFDLRGSCRQINVTITQNHTHTGSVFLKNYIYIILLFYREPYQKYKILTKIRCNI